MTLMIFLLEENLRQIVFNIEPGWEPLPLTLTCCLTFDLCLPPGAWAWSSTSCWVASLPSWMKAWRRRVQTSCDKTSASPMNTSQEFPRRPKTSSPACWWKNFSKSQEPRANWISFQVLKVLLRYRNLNQIYWKQVKTILSHAPYLTFKY